MAQGYLVSYAHAAGFGRVFMATNRKITDDVIVEWEDDLRRRNNMSSLCVIGFQKIAGEIKPAKDNL